MDWTSKSSKLFIKLNSRLEITVVPFAKKILAEPTTSFTFNPEIFNAPPTETNEALAISVSFASWLTLIVRSEVAWHVLSLKVIATVGEKSIHDILNEKFWTSTSPSSEVIVEVKFIIPLFGLWKILLNVTEEVFPLVVELLSPGLVAVILTPAERFSIKKVFASESETVTVDPVIEVT